MEIQLKEEVLLLWKCYNELEQSLHSENAVGGGRNVVTVSWTCS